MSEVLGAQVVHDAGLTRTDEISTLRERVAELKQQLLDRRRDLQERDDELIAACTANHHHPERSNTPTPASARVVLRIANAKPESRPCATHVVHAGKTVYQGKRHHQQRLPERRPDLRRSRVSHTMSPRVRLKLVSILQARSGRVSSPLWHPPVAVARLRRKHAG